MATQQDVTTSNKFPAEVIRQICLEAGADEVGLWKSAVRNWHKSVKAYFTFTLGPKPLFLSAGR